MSRSGVDHDDLPLSGPWNRRRAENTPSADVADAVEVRDYGGEAELKDSPLSGSWNRQTSQIPIPVEDAEAEKNTRSMPRRKHNIPSKPEPEQGVQSIPASPYENTVVNPQEKFGDTLFVGSDNNDKLPAVNGSEIGRERAKILSLLSPSVLYSGIVMSEVLGKRGGRTRRR